MRSNYRKDAERIDKALTRYESTNSPLAGLALPEMRAALIEQVIDSEQRVLYVTRLLERGVDPASSDPTSPAFDPIRAAILLNAAGEYDEAVWMVFLFVHFGKHRRAGWRYIRDVYGRLGEGGLWTWEAVSADVTSFRFWLNDHREQLRAAPGPQGFGNHRKYESLNAWEDTGTGAVFESYVGWIHETGETHSERFAAALALSPEEGFSLLYQSMRAVQRFGRVARFDYLTMLMKLRLLDIRPPHSYIVGATGPLRGARLLFNGDPSDGSPRVIEDKLRELGGHLDVTPDVLEDAVCNWQKTPDRYVRFSG